MSVMELSWLQTGLLLLAPAIVLAAALLLGRYPGEKLLERPRPPRPRRRALVALRLVWTAPVLHVGGGLLLGRSLAGRAPPCEAY
jgi:hypothetical protein